MLKCHWIDECGEWHRARSPRLDLTGPGQFAFRHLGLAKIGGYHPRTLQWDLKRVQPETMLAARKWLAEQVGMRPVSLVYYFGGWFVEQLNNGLYALDRIDRLNAYRDAVPPTEAYEQKVDYEDAVLARPIRMSYDLWQRDRGRLATATPPPWPPLPSISWSSKPAARRRTSGTSTSAIRAIWRRSTPQSSSASSSGGVVGWIRQAVLSAIRRLTPTKASSSRGNPRSTTSARRSSQGTGRGGGSSWNAVCSRSGFPTARRPWWPSARRGGQLTYRSAHKAPHLAALRSEIYPRSIGGEAPAPDTVRRAAAWSDRPWQARPDRRPAHRRSRSHPPGRRRAPK